MIFGLFFSNLRGWFTRWWRHDDVIITTTKISLVYHVISLVPVSSHILNQTSFYKTMIGTFSVPYHVTQTWVTWLKLVTWFFRHAVFVTWHISGVTWYSDLFYSEMFKSDENHLYFSLYMWGIKNSSEFRSKAIWPTADNRLKNSRAPPSGGNPRYALNPIKSIRITR